MRREADPHQLARDLLGREFDDLEADEQRVLRRVASGSFTGRDADELAQGHATRGDLLADRVAEIGGSWAFIIGFGVVLMVRDSVGLSTMKGGDALYRGVNLTQDTGVRDEYRNVVFANQHLIVLAERKARGCIAA